MDESSWIPKEEATLKQIFNTSPITDKVNNRIILMLCPISEFPITNITVISGIIIILIISNTNTNTKKF